jgi:hypothetical protein
MLYFKVEKINFQFELEFSWVSQRVEVVLVRHFMSHETSDVVKDFSLHGAIQILASRKVSFWPNDDEVTLAC